ncbi:MAG: hypothetical protein ACRD4U_05090 [Candidatus Acidiferrales bacterium]
MANKTVFTLAAILMALFFWLSNYDRFFFLAHFLQASFYLIVLLLLFYGLEEWAYVMAVVAPLVWIVLAALAGIATSGVRGLGGLVSGGGLENPVDTVAGFILLGSLALLVASARVYKREVWGRPGALRSALGAIAVVGGYYLVLLYVFYVRIAPPG